MPDPRLIFTYKNIKGYYKKALDLGYEICTCEEYARKKKNEGLDKLIVNRVDVDFSVKGAARLGEIYNALGIKASFFIRLHAPEYNPFSFENYRIIKWLAQEGHEIGYHSEIVDQSVIWNETPEECLTRDIGVMNRMFGVDIKGVASHGGMTGLNNLDFWSENRATDFGLLYEAYESTDHFDLFNTSFYISDSQWTQWKCYDKGRPLAGNVKTFGEHLDDGHRLIYLLIHSDTYYDRHIYEKS